MLKKAFFLLSILAILIVMFLFAFNINKQEHYVFNYSLDSSEVAQILDGDIILRHGHGFVSDGIVELFKEKYDISHCAIVTQDSTGLQVIHSVSQSLSEIDGIQKQSLNSFIRDSKKNSVMVVRFKYPPGFSGLEISKNAREILSRKVPFDHNFNLEDSTEVYCSELIWLAIKNSYNFDVFNGRRDSKIDVMKFAVFWDTTKFDVIINHQLREK